MSKSLKRVRAALEAAGVEPQIMEMGSETRTAAQAAAEAGCEIDQIAKSIILSGANSGKLYLFITAGGRQVDEHRASVLVGETLKRADAAFVRKETGFAIGGVAPVGHLNAPSTYWDPRLSDFQTVYAAAGTPHHIFPSAPERLRSIAKAKVDDFSTETHP